MRPCVAVQFVVAALTASWLAPEVSATFHLMQIEQVIGGVDGDTTAQAIQLRMRAAGQEFVSQARIYVRDATGSNPVLVKDLTTDVANGALGDRVLIVSANFVSHTSPACAPDFVMTNLIPASYLSAGSLTWESDTGVVYWRLSWGGSGYTGSNAGNFINDDNNPGNFGPPYTGPLPSAGLTALQFKNAASATSTSNAADYALTASAAIFTNNAHTSFTVIAPCRPCDTNCDGSVNGSDIESFIALLNGTSTRCSPCAGDTNGDGSINGGDIEAFIVCLNTP